MAQAKIATQIGTLIVTGSTVLTITADMGITKIIVTCIKDGGTITGTISLDGGTVKPTTLPLNAPITISNGSQPLDGIILKGGTISVIAFQ